MRPRERAALGRDRHVEDVGGRRVGARLDLDAVQQRAAAKHPPARRDVRAHRRDEWLAEADEPAVDRHHQRGRLDRPERRPAREGDGHRIAAEVMCLPPPPHRRESRAPVALDVRGGAVEVPAVDGSLGARPQHQRTPVLAQERQMTGRAGAVPRPRPPDHVVQARVDAVEADVLCIARERGPDPHSARVGRRIVEDRRTPAARALRDAHQRPPRADAAQDDRRPPVGPREPPEPAAERALSSRTPSRSPRAMPGRSRRGRRPAPGRRCRPRARCGGP